MSNNYFDLCREGIKLQTEIPLSMKIVDFSVGAHQSPHRSIYQLCFGCFYYNGHFNYRPLSLINCSNTCDVLVQWLYGTFLHRKIDVVCDSTSPVFVKYIECCCHEKKNWKLHCLLKKYCVVIILLTSPSPSASHCAFAKPSLSSTTFHSLFCVRIPNALYNRFFGASVRREVPPHTLCRTMLTICWSQAQSPTTQLCISESKHACAYPSTNITIYAWFFREKLWQLCTK